MLNDDVYGYFYGDYPDGDPRKTPERRIVAALIMRRRQVTSMNQLCEMSDEEIMRLRNIGEKRRPVLLEVIARYKYERLAPFKILMIEDDAVTRRRSRDLFTGCGYEALEAANLAEGRALLETENPDLLILDGVLPDGSGFDFCREVRGSSTIPVLFYSSLHTDEDIAAGLAAGGDDYMVKPGDPDVLAARVDALLRRLDPERYRIKKEGRLIYG